MKASLKVRRRAIFDKDRVDAPDISRKQSDPAPPIEPEW
jgi:hypothetical protein